DEARRRLRLVLGPGAPEREIRRAAWLSLRNVAFNAVDMLRIRKTGLDDLRRMVPQADQCIARLRETLASTGGAGVVLALPHCGNWDLAGSLVELAGLPIFSVAARQRNPYVNRMMNEMREGHGMAVLERDGGPRVFMEMLRRLKRGEIFAILPDTRSRTPGVEVPFLGGKANLARGMGLLAWQTGAAVLPLVMRRTGWRRFSVEFFPVVRADRSAPRETEERRITEEVLALFDGAVRADPGQWFWYNKRWVLDPVERRAEPASAPAPPASGAAASAS
ncbi:MAG: lysophospholipid acyltransferase family protein, partial [Kiritimatiellae bacterium]|nr:lysophospholipid acyltransferase family protein [Kiritimatiellia bacterium]